MQISRRILVSLRAKDWEMMHRADPLPFRGSGRERQFVLVRQSPGLFATIVAGEIVWGSALAR
jgi:hypothetical protein